MQLQIQFEIQQLSVTNYNYLDHLNEVDKENILILVAEAINVIVDHPGVVVDCKPDHNDEEHDEFIQERRKLLISSFLLS